MRIWYGLHLTDLRSASAGDEGGGEPEWLPDGAVIHVDYDNGNYYGGGAVTTKEDLHYATAAHGDWDPETSVTGSGLVASSPGIKQAYITDLLVDGFTAIFEADFQTGGSNRIVAFDDPGGNAEFEMVFFHQADPSNSNGYFVDDSSDAYKEDTTDTLANGLHKCGVTFTPTGFSFCTDGGTVVVSDPYIRDTPPFDSLVVQAFSGAIKNATFYAPMADAALQALTAA